VRLVFYPETALDRSVNPFDKAGEVAEAGEAVVGADGAAAAEVSGAARLPACQEVLTLLPEEMRASGLVEVETVEVGRDWVDGWKDHFKPIVVDRVLIRPPWESALEASASGVSAGLVEVVINPGLGFGTGLHPTTRGTLRLLQDESPGGPVLDAGTGSGVLAVAAAKLGWGPIVAFDNDPVALISARENVESNGVGAVVTLLQAEAEELRPEWSLGATVLANMTLEPVLTLLGRLEAAGPCGPAAPPGGFGHLGGAQEQQLLRAATEGGFTAGRRVYETEWVSMALVPDAESG
jgi:ribosomal protein L11 methyltransferase